MLRTLATLAFALPLIAAIRPDDSFDLTPRFEQGQSLALRVDIEGSFELDEISALLNGFDVLGGGVLLEGTFGVQAALTDEILELRDGALVKLRRSIEEQDVSHSVEFEGMGESHADEGTTAGALVGHTLELSVDEDGELTVVDVTEGEFEAVGDDVLEEQSIEDTYYQKLLPSEPVEEGESWDLVEDQAGLLADFMEGVTEGVGDGEDAAEIAAVLKLLMENASLEAVGTLVGVEDGVALIEWSIEVSIELDDLIGIMQEIADPEELGGIPEGLDSSLSMTMSIEAQGSFDLEQHQLVSLSATGELNFEAHAAFSQPEMVLEANVLLIGSFELSSSIEIQ